MDNLPIENLIFRKAIEDDLPDIIRLLVEDELGKTREKNEGTPGNAYSKAFQMIIRDSNQALMVVDQNKEIIGTCHLTIMPSLTMIGTTRMNIEAVRISEKNRGHRIGEWMINQAIEFGKSKGVNLVQLTTNIKRLRAKNFYERLGFEATHIGMKLRI